MEVCGPRVRMTLRSSVIVQQSTVAFSCRRTVRALLFMETIILVPVYSLVFHNSLHLGSHIVRTEVIHTHMHTHVHVHINLHCTDNAHSSNCTYKQVIRTNHIICANHSGNCSDINPSRQTLLLLVWIRRQVSCRHFLFCVGCSSDPDDNLVTIRSACWTTNTSMRIHMPTIPQNMVLYLKSSCCCSSYELDHG